MTEYNPAKFDQAIQASDVLISALRHHSSNGHPLLTAFVDLWRLRHNTPIVTTIYEAYQEMMAPMKGPSNGKLNH